MIAYREAIDFVAEGSEGDAIDMFDDHIVTECIIHDSDIFVCEIVVLDGTDLPVSVRKVSGALD